MRHAGLLLGPALALVAAVAGCKGGANWTAQDAMKKLSGPSPQELVAMAFDPKDPDRRREGVSLLSQKKWGRQEKYCKGYAMLSREDADPTVRCAAVQALGRAQNRAFLPDVLAALEDAEPTVRQNAAQVLDEMPGEQAVQPLRLHAVGDPSVDVRMWSAKALRHYPRREVLQTLQRCLTDPSFGVTHQAHEAMVELTRRDLGRDADAWEAVVRSDDPFTPPQTLKKPWWQWGSPKAKKAQPPAPAGERSK